MVLTLGDQEYRTVQDHYLEGVILTLSGISY